MKHLRRYQVYLDGWFVGFYEGWNLTGPQALSRSVAEMFGNDAAMRLRVRGNSGHTIVDGRRYELRASKV